MFYGKLSAFALPRHCRNFRVKLNRCDGGVHSQPAEPVVQRTENTQEVPLPDLGQAKSDHSRFENIKKSSEVSQPLPEVKNTREVSVDDEQPSKIKRPRKSYRSMPTTSSRKLRSK